MASGGYAKITYVVLIHMYQGRTGLLREKVRFEQGKSPFSLASCIKVEKKKRVTRYQYASETQVLRVLDIKEFQVV